MSLLRMLGRLSALEWLLAGLVLLAVASLRPATESHLAALRRLIDACAVLAIGGLLGGALLDVYWLSFGGVLAAAAGLGLAGRLAGQNLRGWLLRLLRRK